MTAEPSSTVSDTRSIARSWWERRFVLIVGLVAGVGLVLRLVAVLTDQDPIDGVPFPFTIGGDGVDYYWTAETIADGGGYVGLSGAHTRPPVWPLFLAPFSPLDIPNHPLLTHQLVAAVLGTVSVVLVAFAGRRVAGARVGLIAAAVAAIYPGFWIYEKALLSETALIAAVAGFVILAYRFLARPSAALATALGFMVGLLTLIRTEQTLVAVVIVAPLILTRRVETFRTRLIWSVSAALAMALVIVPWLGFNNDRLGSPVLATSLGNTMNAGNCDGSYHGSLLGFYDTRCNLRISGQGPDDPVERDLWLRDRAFDYLADNAPRVPVVVAAREARVWGLFRPAQTARLWSDWSETPIWTTRLWLGGTYVLLPLAGVGVWRLRRRSIPVFPLLGFIGIVLAAVALTIGEPRYRAAGAVPMAILAATGVEWVGVKLWSMRGSRERTV